MGVDVFFVISGFLISGLILSGLGSGSFSFLEFYARRVRRLFPALIAVLLTVLAISYVTLLPGEYALSASTLWPQQLLWEHFELFRGGLF